MAAALLLAGCATSSLSTAHKDAERVDITANLSYVAVAQSVNAYEAVPGRNAAQIAAAENVKLEAWKALMDERAAYAAGDAALQAAAAARVDAQKGAMP